MLLKISHRTEYHYDAPVSYALQRVRLTPTSGPTQTVHEWSLHIEGACSELRFRDQFANETRLVSVEGAPPLIVVEACGIVETRDTDGVVGVHQGFVPLWLFCRPTPLTSAGEGIGDIVAAVGQGGELERMHRLAALVGERIRYVAGATGVATSAEEALALGAGVCQDHSHAVIAAARAMGFPARYVSGYLLMDGVTEQVASHAWAEAHVSGLGWVGFDAANGVCPDERYVRVATGCDYRDAMPISGVRTGPGQERLAVRITIEQ